MVIIAIPIEDAVIYAESLRENEKVEMAQPQVHTKSLKTVAVKNIVHFLMICSIIFLEEVKV